MFSVNDRERIRDWVLHLAATDPRIVAGAVVGSLADTPGDRWSDLDLTFAVGEGISVVDVLDDWTRQLGYAVHHVLRARCCIEHNTATVIGARWNRLPR